MKNLLSICLILSTSIIACGQKKTPEQKIEVEVTQTKSAETMSKTEDEWKSMLDPEQFRVLREKGTERPYSGEFDKHYKDGKYTCAGCGEVLFVSGEKFDAGCGWPSFSDAAAGKVNTHKDVTLGMVRTEITCSNCGGHLGHVFDDGPTETGQRYCVNSLSLGFIPDGEEVIKNENEKEK